MIRPLRERHRAMVCTLGLLLPLAFAIGMFARKPVPVAAPVASELAGRARDFGKVVWTKANIWPGQRIITSLRRDTEGSLAVELMFRDLAKPDLLFYWVAGKETPSESLPGNARLLGVLSNQAPLPISSDIRGQTGRFVLYSLADHEIVAASQVFTF
jgi:hypothetical protein